MNQDNNIWEQLETHMHEYLGIYGLEMLSALVDLKEQAEDRGIVPTRHSGASGTFGADARMSLRF